MTDLRIRNVSRRTVLAGAAAMTAGSAIASRAGPSVAQTPAAPVGITIPAPATALPGEDVTFRWVDSGDAKAFFWQEFFARYTEAHANITVDYQGLPWNEIQQVIPLGVQNGNAPDVFQVPLNVPPPLAWQEGWGAAWDDIIPDFAALKASLPAGTFVNGITMFEGKTYALPMTGNRRHGSLLLYNASQMAAAGLDPVATPFTWDSFREAARTLTAQGGGEYYGLIFEGGQSGRFAEWANNFAALSGFGIGTPFGSAPFDWRTGEFVITAPEIQAAIELLLAMRDDGSIFPGSGSLNAPEARARIPQGAASMIIQGPWNVTQWRKDSPDFQFGVAATPKSAADTTGFVRVGPGGANQVWAFADSPYHAIAGDVLAYALSPEGQAAWAGIVGVADAPIRPEALTAVAAEDALVTVTTEIFDASVRLGPDPRVRNEATASVFQAIQPVQPDFGTLVQGMFAGQISDISGTLQQVQDQWNTELERAIGAANEGGAGVSRDDFVFADWDPNVDYAAS